MLDADISFDRIWVAGYLMVCGDLRFCLWYCLRGAAGGITLVPTSTYLASPANT